MTDTRISDLPVMVTPTAADEHEVNNGGTSRREAKTSLFGAGFATVGQLKFPATQIPSSDANTLDDYEEGTWTPQAVSYDGVMTVNGATYTKIGHLVVLRASVSFDGTADASTVNITNLPFTAASAANGDGGFITFCTNGTLKYLDLSSTTNLRFYDSAAALVTYTALGTADVQFVVIYSV